MTAQFFLKTLTLILLTLAISFANEYEDYLEEGVYEDEIPCDETADISAKEGDSIFIKLTNVKSDASYQIDSYDNALIKFVKTERSASGVYFLFEGLKPGEGKLKLLLVEDGNTISSFCYIINVSEKEIEKTENKTTQNTTEKKQEDSEEKKLYEVAVKMFNGAVYEQALKGFENIKTRFPQSEYAVKSIAKIGDINFLLEKFADAESAYQSVIDSLIATDEERARAYFFLGRSLEKQGKNNEAVKEYLTGQKFYTDSTFAPSALYYSAVLLKNMGKELGAQGSLQTAIDEYEKFDSREDALYMLASIYDIGGKAVMDIEKAHKYYTMYIEEYPKGKHIKESGKRKRHLEKNFLKLR